MASPSNNRAAVQATNDDATASKLSCVKKGYIKDNYVHLFVRRPMKRSPIINRGYYARWAAIRKLLFQFLDAGMQTVDDTPLKKQVVSLGAGYDTTFFQLQEEGKAPTLYVELDFKEVTSKKAAIINSHEQLRDKIGNSPIISQERGEVHSEKYKLLPVDLCNIKELDAIFDLAQLDSRVVAVLFLVCMIHHPWRQSNCCSQIQAGRKLLLWTWMLYTISALICRKGTGLSAWKYLMNSRNGISCRNITVLLMRSWIQRVYSKRLAFAMCSMQDNFNISL